MAPEVGELKAWVKCPVDTGDGVLSVAEEESARPMRDSTGGSPPCD
jgi:hypothetical protein